MDSPAGNGEGTRADSMRQHSPPFDTEGRSVATLQQSIPQPPAAAQIGTVAMVVAKAMRINRVFMVCRIRIAFHQPPSALTRLCPKQGQCQTPSHRWEEGLFQRLPLDRKSPAERSGRHRVAAGDRKAKGLRERTAQGDD